MTIFFSYFALACFTAAGQTRPSLSIDVVAPQTLRIAWTNSAVGFGLEQSGSVGVGAFWQRVKAPIVEESNQLLIVLNATPFDQFFRLRLPVSTGIADTSPVDGETGVAVTRETIIHFT